MSTLCKDLTHEEGVVLADAINRLLRWLCAADIIEPTQKNLAAVSGRSQADACILYGASILAGVDAFVSALREELGKTTMVSGGRGHSTEGLLATIEAEHPGLVSANATEADAVCAYLEHRGDPLPKLIERRSNNCGSNVVCSVELLREAGVVPETLLIIQDPVFMRRMKATFERQEPTIDVYGLAAYDCEIIWADGIGLTFEQPIPHGMWSLERFLSLLSGEVPRLRNDENGYGPKGKDYLISVCIPPEIEKAQALLEGYLGGYRQANPAFSSSRILNE